MTFPWSPEDGTVPINLSIIHILYLEWELRIWIAWGETRFRIANVEKPTAVSCKPHVSKCIFHVNKLKSLLLLFNISPREINKLLLLCISFWGSDLPWLWFIFHFPANHLAAVIFDALFFFSGKLKFVQIIQWKIHFASWKEWW